jgi:surface polysaccharide O-acyltransferase-like enzyme
MNDANKSKRIFYLDALRALAILCVVLLHVTGHLNELMAYNGSTIYSLSGYFEIFANNFFRIGVDLFLMLSGALLLGRDWDIKGFLAKRLPRIIKPFVFWSLIFTVVIMCVSYLVPSANLISQFGIYGFLNLFWDTLMGNAPGSGAYWFFWMMIGVYLIMPVLNRWINHSDLSEVEYFLVLWVITTVFEYTFMMDCSEILNCFTSPIGLAVLGYYLRYSDRRVFNNPLFALILIVMSSVLMFSYSYIVADTSVLFSFHRYSILEIVEVIGVFCLFKCSSYMNNPNDIVRRAISSIAMCSYGMYLIHSQIMMAFRKLLHIHLNFLEEYVFLFLVGFMMSWIIIHVLSKVPILDEYAGAE